MTLRTANWVMTFVILTLVILLVIPDRPERVSDPGTRHGLPSLEYVDHIEFKLSDGTRCVAVRASGGGAGVTCNW